MLLAGRGAGPELGGRGGDQLRGALILEGYADSNWHALPCSTHFWPSISAESRSISLCPCTAGTLATA